MFLGKPSKLFDTTNPDWVPTLKLGHDKLTISTSKATAPYSRSKERSTKKIKLEALSNKQKTCDSSLDVDFNTEYLKTCMISYTTAEFNYFEFIMKMKKKLKLVMT